MQIHQIQKMKIKSKKRQVGRGGKRGTYSGRGLKGQKSRAGTFKKEPITKNLIKRYPKLRGSKPRLKGTKNNYAIINLSDLKDKFNFDEVITPETLYQKGLIRKKVYKLLKIKILGRGNIKGKTIIKNCFFSKSVKGKMENFNQQTKPDLQK